MERGITTVDIMKMPVLFVGVSNTTIVCTYCSVNGSVNFISLSLCFTYIYIRGGGSKFRLVRENCSVHD